MKLLWIILAIFLLAVVASIFAEANNDYILVTFQDWTIQTSLVFFISALIALFVVCYFVLRSILYILDLPNKIKRWQQHHSQHRAEKYLSNGLVHMTEGRWKHAERTFLKAAKYSQTPYINYLYAARAAQELGRIEKRDEYLYLAQQNNPDADLVIGITKAELQLSEHQTDQALETLKSLPSKKQNQVKHLLLHTYTDLNDWNAILTLLDSIEKTGLYPREQIQAKRLDAYASLLKDAGTQQDPQQLNTCWGTIPKKLKQHLYLIEVYVSERLKLDNAVDCEKLVHQALKRQWDHILVRLYGLIGADDLSKQLNKAEAWLKEHPNDPTLLLTLGRLCLRKHLWGKAKGYLQESIAIQPNPEAYYEYAKLHEQDGDDKAAALCYEKGLALATNVTH